MLNCGFEYYQIGGPYIAENPACPWHGAEAQAKLVRQDEAWGAVIDTLLDFRAGEIELKSAVRAIKTALDLE